MTISPTLRACALVIVSALSIIGSAPVRADATEDFAIAVRNDHDSTVRDLLARGVDPNTRDARGQPMLTIAMQEKSQKVARLLVAQPSIALDALNKAGESPLMIAALKGDLPDARLLLDRGAKVDQPGWTALHYAATGPEPQLVSLLLDRGAAIDAPSPNGSTPLMMAAQYGSEESVRMLVARGADLGARNQLGLSPADFARRAGRDYLVKLLDQAAARR